MKGKHEPEEQRQLALHAISLFFESQESATAGLPGIIQSQPVRRNERDRTQNGGHTGLGSPISEQHAGFAI